MKALVLLGCLLAGVAPFQFDTKSKVGSGNHKIPCFAWNIGLPEAKAPHQHPDLTQEKAPTLTVNCGCQCSSPSLTFQDASGQVQGNCRRSVSATTSIPTRHPSADSEGGVWCYVGSGEHSTCRDLRPSNR